MPSMRLSASTCFIATLCAVLAAQVSAARHLSTRAAASAGAGVLASRRTLLACSPTCSTLLVSASNFGVLAGSTVTSDGPTVIYGDVGVYPGSSVTGFPPARATGVIHTNAESAATKAQADAHSAFATLNSTTPTANLTGQDLGNMTLLTGVYSFAEGALLTGNLTFDAAGDVRAIFIIQTSTTFVTAVGAQVLLANGAQACNVFYAVGSSATIAAATQMVGNILAYQSVVLFGGASVDGSILALTAAITLDNNSVTAIPECGSDAPPSPSS